MKKHLLIMITFLFLSLSFVGCSAGFQKPDAANINKAVIKLSGESEILTELKAEDAKRLFDSLKTPTPLKNSIKSAPIYWVEFQDVDGKELLLIATLSMIDNPEHYISHNSNQYKIDKDFYELLENYI